jgi:methionyl-tRNA synthetase
MPKPVFYITTAIDYTNGKPHLGHLYEKIISDAIARWHRLKNEEVYFLTGTDEHGQKISQAAEANSKKPKEFVDEISQYFRQLCEKLNISNNDFIRTTESRHKKLCQKAWQKVLDKGLLYKGTYEGLYCTGCEAYYTEKDLVNGICPVHQKAPEKVTEETYFFKLSQYQETLLKLYQEHPEFILPQFRQNEIINRLKEGLKDLSSSRKTLKWGIKLPNDKEHVIYVWFDALLNYITALGWPDKKKFQKYWPASVQVIGKDILWFHTVIWPAILTALDLPLPKTIFAHGWVHIGGQKMSKSLGKTIDPFQITNDYGTDKVRYYFLREIPAGQDGDYSDEALIERTNSELADALGNLLQRTSVLVHKKYNGTIPKPGKFGEQEKSLIEQAKKLASETDSLVQKFELHKAVEKIWEFINACNKYANDTAPWQITDEQRLATVLYTLVESLRIISILTWPFIPASAEKIASQLGQKIGRLKNAKFKKTTKGTLQQPTILFNKIETTAPAKNSPPASEIEPFRKLMLRIGIVEDVRPHPNADKLYVLKIDLGKEKRTLCAGLKQYIPAEQLKGKHLVIVANLKPAMLRGIESQGMMLAAQLGNVVLPLEAPNSPAGTDVFVEGLPCEHSQISIEDFAKVKITTKSGKAVYKDKPLKTDKEEITVAIGDGATVR